ncbi:MAG: Membrane protein [Fibrobacteres bacterium]|nr:Membrane protein [Fibrobacterota bacterium]
MGKPAARMGDTTAHGGTIVLGNPTLLIGKMPASTLGDMHVCPMCTGPVPHVGGPITLGSTGVFLGKKPAARVSDLSVCVGPPSMPAMGCMTVLIGEAGSGSQAGSASAAAAAQASKIKGPKAVEAFPVGEPSEAAESHEILVEFTDSAGNPLSGVAYLIKDPDKRDIVGMSTMDGAASHGGYAKKGDYELIVKCLADVKWEKAEAGLKDSVKYSAKADAFADGEAATVMIMELCGGTRRLLETVECKVQGEKISGEWKWKKAYLPPAGNPPMMDHPVFFVYAVSGGQVGVSGPLKLSDKLSVQVRDSEGAAKKRMDYELHLSNGEVRTGKLDDSGKVTAEGLPPGNHTLKLVQPGTADAAAANRPAPKAKHSGFGDLKEAEREQEEKEKNPDENVDPKGAEKVSGKGHRFPLKDKPMVSYKNPPLSYGSHRSSKKVKNRKHAGCDLYAPVGTEVLAVADGIVVAAKPFYAGTHEVAVDHGPFTVRYGEIKSDMPHGIKVGAKVSKGQIIGHVGQLENIKQSMLHFELYDNSAKGELSDLGNPPYFRRKDNIDPESFLNELET